MGNAMSDLVATMLTAAGEGAEHEVVVLRCSIGRQNAPSAPDALDGSSAGETRRTPSAAEMAARRNVGMAPRPTPGETSSRGWTTPEARMRTHLSLVAAEVVIAGQLFDALA